MRRDVGIGQCRRHDRCLITGQIRNRLPCVASHAGFPGRELDDLRALLLRRIAESQIQNRQFFLQVGRQQDDRRGASRVVDRRLRVRENIGRQSVAQLRVHRVDAEGGSESRPCVRVFVRAASTAKNRQARTGRLGDDRCGRGDGGTPRRLAKFAIDANHRIGQSGAGLHGLEVEATLVAQPAMVHGITVDALITQQFVATAFECDAASDGTRGARALRLLEVPGTRLEAVRLRGECTNRTDLNGVTREVRTERFVGERLHLRVVATRREVNERVAGHLVGEARATVAQDATLAIEKNEIADRDRLLIVTLLFDETALTGTVAERLILQRTLATLVAHRAVERVVRKKKLDDAFLRALHLFGFGAHHLTFGDRGHATDHHHRTTRAFDFHQTLAAHADRIHARVVTEARDVITAAIGRGDDEFSLAGGHGAAVDRHRNGVRIHGGLVGLGRRFGGGHDAAPTAVTGIMVRFVTRAANSSGKRTRAELMGA